MPVCACAPECGCLLVQMYVHVSNAHVHLCAHVCMHECVCMNKYMCAGVRCMHALMHMCVCACVGVPEYVCMYVCMPVWVCVHTCRAYVQFIHALVFMHV